MTVNSPGGATTSGAGLVLPEQTWRLTSNEYANTVSDLLGIAPSAQTVPLAADGIAGGFAVGSLFGDTVVQNYHDSAVALSALAAANLGQLLQPVGCSLSAGASCASSFISTIAPLAFRHGTVDSETLAGLNALYTTVAGMSGGSPTLGIQAVIQEILQSPYFLYHLETEEQAKGVGQVSVTGYSMANRLSYLLWGSMPDSTLFAAAEANQLTTPAQIAGQASRMIGSQKAHTGLQNFWQQWMQPVPVLSSKAGNSTQITAAGTLSTTPLYSPAGSTGESFATVYTPALQQSLEQSFGMQVEAALWAPSGAMRTLLTSDTVYANGVLAPLFGVTATGTTLAPVQVDTTKRIGILSHPALMATYATDNTSHPIKRGRYVWSQIMCQPLPDPPPSVPPFTPPSPGMSLRQDFELLTATGPYANEPMCTEVGATMLNGKACEPLGTDGTPLACPGCHARINPVGFLFEPFDTLGNYRTIDDYGQPVDLTNIIMVQASDPNLNGVTASSMDLAQKLAKSDAPNQCLTKQIYEFMAHRADTTADMPVEAQLDSTFDQANQSIVPVLVALTQTQVFLNRTNVQ
jgi:hypothetical protein